MDVRELYRPVGLHELRLIRDSGYSAFPPRLSHQPIFYPVLEREYAVQIARDWNTQDVKSAYMGAVTSFDVDRDYLAQFEVQVVGGRSHRELWVEAERLPEFNQHILGSIRVIDVFYGDRYADERAW